MLFRSVQFVWAGGFSFGKLSDGYEELKKVVNNPPANVKFLGIVEREDMNGVYNAADVMFLPSYDELFPMTILEAMCVNVPVLLRKLPIYDNILFDFYYAEDSVEGFVNALNRLKDDKEYYNTAAANSKRGNEYYKKESVLKMWDDYYTSVLKNK